MSQFQSKKIIEVLQMIQNYDLVLPAFQREYVWKPEQVERLFDSLMKGYPINSMLFWKVGKDIKGNYKFYKMLDKYIENKQTHNDVFDTSLKESFQAIIDGQQRLTSLNLGLRGSYAYRRKRSWVAIDSNYPTRHLYLNLTTQLTEEESGMTYDFEFMEEKETGRQDLYEDKEGRKWFRVGKILDFADESVQWAYFREKDMTQEEGSVLMRLYRMVFDDTPINYYEVDSSEPDVAVDVFVRTNSGGTTLNYADILLSITIANWENHNRDARSEIYGLVDMVNNIGFNITHDYVLKSFLYLKDKDVKMRVTSFNNGLLDTIAAEWDDIKEATLELFRLLRMYGLNGQTLTSNYATLPILYYIYQRKIWKNFVENLSCENDRTIIKRWLMKTLLLRTFGFRSDGSLRKSRNVLQNGEWRTFPAIEIEHEIGQSVTESDFYETVLSYQKESRMAFVVLSLLYQGTTFDGFGYHLDHIHSAKVCIEKGLNKDVWNSVVNLQMLSERENESKGAMELSEWVDKKTASASVSKDGFWESHLIPNTDLSIEHFTEFIEARQKLLIERLKMVL